MRGLWIAIIGLGAGCQTFPSERVLFPSESLEFPCQRTRIPCKCVQVNKEQQRIVVLPPGVEPGSHQYFPADRSRVHEPVVRVTTPRRRQVETPSAPTRHRQVEMQLVSLHQAPVVFRLGGEMDYGYEHSWLVGRIQKHGEKWRLRYDLPRSCDRYGGCLELLFAEPIPTLREGMLLRVEGDVLDPAPFEIQPSYRVRSWKLLS